MEANLEFGHMKGKNKTRFFCVCFVLLAFLCLGKMSSALRENNCLFGKEDEWVVNLLRDHIRRTLRNQTGREQLVMRWETREDDVMN